MKNIFNRKFIVTTVSFVAVGICTVSLTSCNANLEGADESTAAFLQEEQKSEKAETEAQAFEQVPQSSYANEVNSVVTTLSERSIEETRLETEIFEEENNISNANEIASEDGKSQDKSSQTDNQDTSSTQNAKPIAESNERKAAFISALEGICRDQVFPDGSEFCYDASTNGEGNQFAIYDIDFDGKDELIIQHTTTYTAGMVEVIYDYDSKTKLLKEELISFPALTYYNNGIISEDWSHNQGLAGLGDFWPYTLYQYEQESDTYIEIASVDAWNKEQANEDYEGNPFPDELDIDGDGFIYFVTAEGIYAQDTVVDGEEYNRWRNSLLGNAKKVEVPYQTLNEDNVQSLQ